MALGDSADDCGSCRRGVMLLCLGLSAENSRLRGEFNPPVLFVMLEEVLGSLVDACLALITGGV